MNKSNRMRALMACLLLVASGLAAPLPLDAANAPARAGQDEELGEVIVSGARINRNPDAIIAWLKRLLGQFSYEGYVELGSDGAPGRRRAIEGESRCGGFGPAVHCVVQVNWPEIRGSDGGELPGGASTLSPAMVMYAADFDYLAVKFMQVDNRGVADSARGYIRGNTLTTTSDCVDLPGKCKRTTRIDARPDGKLIEIDVDIEQDGTRLVHQAFVLHRIGEKAR